MTESASVPSVQYIRFYWCQFLISFTNWNYAVKSLPLYCYNIDNAVKVVIVLAT